MFPSEAGTPLDDVNVARRFQAIVRKAGLPRFNLYSTRHSFASHLLAMGAPITYVANQMGHAKATTTLAHYAHFLPRGDRALADRLEALRSGPQVVRKVASAPAPSLAPAANSAY